MKAVFVEKKGVISIRDTEIRGSLGANSVRIRVRNVGICGSDVHYYTHGGIGPYIVKAPMILGHEAAGEVLEVGPAVTGLSPGDRVCMEPGVPNPASRASKLGLYNLDPGVTFWATPPVDGCLIEEVIHPAEYTYKLPDNVSFPEGAMVEPLAIGLQAAKKARLAPGDVAVVIGAGTIGIMCALSALAGGCGRVYVVDNKKEKLAIAAGVPGIVPVNFQEQDPLAVVREATDGWGADVVLEASGAGAVFPALPGYCRPGGRIVLVGIPLEQVKIDVAAIQAKELDFASVFRYANIYPSAINLISSGRIDVKRLVSATYPMAEAVAAFERAARQEADVVKIMLEI